ncbi:hypothetical protein OHD50_09225 [Escherichia coli]|nr:hypothetical protein [Escherichia coli]
MQGKQGARTGGRGRYILSKKYAEQKNAGVFYWQALTMSIMEMNNDIFTADYVVFQYSSLCAVSSFWWVQSRERFLAQTD